MLAHNHSLRLSTPPQITRHASRKILGSRSAPPTAPAIPQTSESHRPPSGSGIPRVPLAEDREAIQGGLSAGTRDSRMKVKTILKRTACETATQFRRCRDTPNSQGSKYRPSGGPPLGPSSRFGCGWMQAATRQHRGGQLGQARCDRWQVVALAEVGRVHHHPERESA